MRVWCVALAALMTMPAGAQVAATRARPDSTNAPPRFPAMLRSAHLGGAVRARVVVDTAGRVVLEGFKVLHSDHELFTMSLRNALVRWRFVPARRDGRAIPDTIEQDVRFNMPSELAIAAAEPVVLARTVVAPGHFRLVIGWPDPDPAPTPLDATTTSELALATLDVLVGSLVPPDTSPTRIVCVDVAETMKVGQPDGPAMLRLARARLAVLVARRCPPTFASMIALVDSDGRVVSGPPGEDPWTVEILAVRPYAEGIAVVQAAIHHGTGSSYHRCRADRDPTTPMNWRVECEVWQHVVSRTQSVRPQAFEDIASR